MPYGYHAAGPPRKRPDRPPLFHRDGRSAGPRRAPRRVRSRLRVMPF